ncbi:NAD(P)/FAD-dependent oxidoreductase [Antarctobacter sp.]|uniref:NAD(P)/FAD-dependent oxidoreductase n=1 Tax=Antarctobacter sp. TaxID=1872577 RepID=UPI003A8DC7B7
MRNDAKVAIVGGGIVGCAVLYALAKRGWTDAVLLERLELTAGSTWHAAGNITHFGHYAEITRLYVDSLKTYQQAEAQTGQSIGFHPTGSLRLATSAAELEAYKTLEPLYEKLGVPYNVVDADEVERLHPLVNTDGLFGAAHTPADGHVDASGATHALAKAARAMGADIRRQCPVTHIRQIANQCWQLVTETGTHYAEHVVLAASFWTRELALQLGLDLPLYAFEHHEVITDDVPELKAMDREVPTIRDPAAPANTRQERHSLLCGVYETDPVLWATDGIPKAFGQELLVPDMDRLENHLIHVMARIPAFGASGIKAVNNGPLCFPPDGCPLVGPVLSHAGLWLAAGFPVGIGTGGGAGKYLADWMVDGKPPYSLPLINPARFATSMSAEDCFAQMKRTYARGYVMPTITR